MKGFRVNKSLPPEPSPELFARIISKISQERKNYNLRRLVFYSVIFVASVISLVPAIGVLVNSATETGFSDFIYLLFTDYSVILVYWQSFSLALLETLPVASTIICLTLVLIILESLKIIIRDAKVPLSRFFQPEISKYNY
jgi:ABC-type phosphate/phosphonate transport system permease subunit